MPVKGICHAFQFEYSLCFLVLAKFENYYLFRLIGENCLVNAIEKAGLFNSSQYSIFLQE